MLHRVKSRAKAALAGLTHRQKFDCPCCGWHGVFLDVAPPTGRRLHAECPRCGALERHRLQSLVMDEVLRSLDPARLSMLHFAPEPFFTLRFRPMFGRYETADLERPGVDHHVDLQSLPFRDGSYDVVYASHVLEHIQDDHAAIREIRRVLRPGGIAVLPVPIMGALTVEYDAPNPLETMHVRAPGMDYHDRYLAVFTSVDVFDSDRYPLPNQPHVLISGERKRGYVPVCYA